MLGIIGYNKRRQCDEETQAIDDFIRAHAANDEKSIDRAIQRFAELGMGEGTGARIREEMLKKGLTPSERAFLNLGRKGKARELELLEFAQ